MLPPKAPQTIDMLTPRKNVYSIFSNLNQDMITWAQATWRRAVPNIVINSVFSDKIELLPWLQLFQSL